VLICVGGLLPGERAVDPVVSVVSHGCVDRIVARSDCMFVCGTTSKVHVMSPLIGAGGFESAGVT
jgi:hypothetical protein